MVNTSLSGKFEFELSAKKSWNLFGSEFLLNLNLPNRLKDLIHGSHNMTLGVEIQGKLLTVTCKKSCKQRFYEKLTLEMLALRGLPVMTRSSRQTCMSWRFVEGMKLYSAHNIETWMNSSYKLHKVPGNLIQRITVEGDVLASFQKLHRRGNNLLTAKSKWHCEISFSARPDALGTPVIIKSAST